MAKKATAKKKIDMDRMVELVRSIKEHEQVKKQLEAEIKEAQDEIKAVMTEHKLEEMLADVFTVRYKPVTSSRFDSAAFKVGNPDMYKMYQVESTAMKFTIT